MEADLSAYRDYFGKLRGTIVGKGNFELDSLVENIFREI